MALLISLNYSKRRSTKPIGPYDYTEYRESDNGGSVYFDGTTNTYLNVSSSAGGIAIGSGILLYLFGSTPMMPPQITF